MVESISAVTPSLSINVFFALILIVVILVFAYAFLKYRKHVKILSAVVLITVVVGAGIWAVWYSEANIAYYFIAPYTTAAEDNSLDIYCQNVGHLTGTFSLVLSYVNAHFSQKSSLPYQLIDQRTVKYTFTLQPGQAQITRSWFIIDQNVNDFYINLAYQQAPGNLLIKEGPAGVTSTSYQKDPATGNFTMRLQLPPP